MCNTKFVSTRYNNCQYAPGLSLYGIDGRAGVSGENGASLFICIYDINDTDDRGKFGNAVRHGNTMTMEEPKPIGRSYCVGDTFLFPDGKMYSIKRGTDDNPTQYLDIIVSAGDTLTLDQFNECMSFVGRITIENQSDRFTSESNRLVLNTNDYKGFVVNNSGADDIGSIEAPLTIIGSQKTAVNGIERYLDIKSIQTGMSDAQLRFYYDENNNTYVIESDRPICINADFKVEGDQSKSSIGGYSGISTTDTPITSFKGICEDTHYTIGDPSVNYEYYTKKNTCQIYNHEPVDGKNITSIINPETGEPYDNCKFWWYDTRFKYEDDSIDYKKAKQICIHTFIKSNAVETPMMLYFTYEDESDEDKEKLADAPCIDIMENSELVKTDSKDCQYYKSKYFYVPSEANMFIIVAPDSDDVFFMVYETGAPAQPVDEAKEKNNHETLIRLFADNFPINVLSTATAHYSRDIVIKYTPTEQHLVLNKNVFPTSVHIKGMIDGLVGVEFYKGIGEFSLGGYMTTISIDSYHDIAAIDEWSVSLIGISEIEITELGED